MPAAVLLLTSFAFAQSVPPAPPRKSTGAAPLSYKDLKPSALRLYEPPQPARFQLSNGMKVLLLENHETPLVSVTALIRAGSVFDPPDRAGLAALAGALLRSGGVNRRTPERLDADLEALGTTIESNISETSGTVTMSSLKETLGESLALFRAVLEEPSFRQDRIDFQRAAAINAIGRRNDDPAAALDYEFRARIHGQESARARRPEYSTIGRITRGDITAFYRRYFFPANVVLALAGDFDTAQMKDSLESLFGGWKNDQAPVGEFPKDANPSVGGYLAVKPGLRETYFTAGRSGGFFNDKDDAAAEVAAAVLGAGFGKRLATRAPEASGSTRELHAEWRPGFGVPGAFSVTGASRPQDTGEAIRTVFGEIEKLRTTETTEEDLRIAREAVLIRFSSGLDKPAKALEMLAKLEYYGYSADALQRFQKAVAAVTRADVLRAAKEQLDPAGLTVVAFSSLTGFEKPLHPGAGADMPIDLTIPFPTERGAGPATSSEQGKLLLQRAQQAAGGVERLAAVKDFTQTASYRLREGGTESQTDRWIPPAHVRQDAQSTSFGALYRYTDGTTGWLSNGRSSLALAGINAKQAREETLRSYISLLLSDRVPGRVISALDEQTIEITQGDLATRVVFDPQTGLPSKLLYELQLERQPVMFAEEELSDYREVNGIKLPFAIGVFRNGVKYSDGVVSEYKFNQALKTEILQRRP
jgi:zinc protease